MKPSASRPGGAGQGRAGQADTVVPRRLPQEVRIIAGQWRRSRLPVADAPGLRPTPDRVRQTLFDWLGQDLTGWRCVDAFAGSGAAWGAITGSFFGAGVTGGTWQGGSALWGTIAMNAGAVTTAHEPSHDIRLQKRVKARRARRGRS